MRQLCREIGLRVVLTNESYAQPGAGEGGHGDGAAEGAGEGAGEPAAEEGRAQPQPQPQPQPQLLPTAAAVNANGALYWIPFRRASAARWDLHPRRGERGAAEDEREYGVDAAGTDEPTHYCHTPLLWAPVYDGLARALEMASEVAAAGLGL